MVYTESSCNKTISSEFVLDFITMMPGFSKAKVDQDNFSSSTC